MSLQLRLARLAGVIAGWLTVEFLLRVSDHYHPIGLPVLDEDQEVDDELQPADVSDVVIAHIVTFHGPEAPRTGECAC